MLQATGKEPGSVWIEYADPSPEDNIKRAAYVASIAAITPGDPFAVMSRQQMQTYLEIDHDQWQKDEEYKDETDPQPETSRNFMKAENFKSLPRQKLTPTKTTQFKNQPGKPRIWRGR